MLEQLDAPVSHFPAARAPARAPQAEPQRRPRGTRLTSAIAFVLAAALVLAYALPGGAYDIVLRQKYGLVIWALLGVGVAFGVLPRGAPSKWTWILVAALCAYAAWTGLSLSWSDSAERTTAELARVLDYIGLVVLVSLALDRSSWRPALAGLATGAGLVCALAVASRLLPAAFPVNTLQQAGITHRLSYPFGYWNAVGAWGAMTTALALAWSAHDRSRQARAAALAVVPVAVTTTYLSYSRAGVIGTVVGVLAVLVLSSNRLTVALHALVAATGAAVAILAVRSATQIAAGTGTRGLAEVLAGLGLAIVIGAVTALLTARHGVDDRRLRGVGGQLVPIGAVVCVLIAGAVYGPGLARRAYNNFRHPAVVTTSDPSSRLSQLSGTRYAVWRTALDSFAAHPATGTGAGTFEFSWDRHATDSEFIRNAHSFELENLAELGAPGLALLVAVMGGAVAVGVAARRRSRRAVSLGATTGVVALFVVYLVQASVDWLWQSTAVTVLALAAVAAAGARLSGPRPRPRWWWRAPVVVAAAAALLMQLPGLLSTVEIRRSQAAEQAGQPQLALAWAKAAVAAEPWAASPYEQRGLVLEAGGRLAGAATDLRRAIAREPQNFRHWLILSRIETERRQLESAERDYRQARWLRPRALVFAYAPFFKAMPG